jgi:hypothetical protein
VEQEAIAHLEQVEQYIPLVAQELSLHIEVQLVHHIQTVVIREVLVVVNLVDKLPHRPREE